MLFLYFEWNIFHLVNQAMNRLKCTIHMESKKQMSITDENKIYL